MGFCEKSAGQCVSFASVNKQLRKSDLWCSSTADSAIGFLSLLNISISSFVHDSDKFSSIVIRLLRLETILHDFSKTLAIVGAVLRNLISTNTSSWPHIRATNAVCCLGEFHIQNSLNILRIEFDSRARDKISKTCRRLS